MDMKRVRPLRALALALAAICAMSLLAQERKKKGDTGLREVQGTVVDSADKFVVGAVVQLKDMRTLQVRSFISQENGAYHFSGLKVEEDYELKADFNGMTSGSRRLSIYDSRSDPVVNLKLDKKQEPGK
jgi:hypothetical protein